MPDTQAVRITREQGYCLEPLGALDWKDLLPLAAAHGGTDRGYIQQWLEAQSLVTGVLDNGTGAEAYRASATVSELIFGRKRADSSLHGRW